ncbi:MAG: hypothetical protein MK239_07115, partial [Gemmatimonadetes bacterium]|nr:hypothetical protein [Gemmatimonadota bacterium]
MRDPHSCYLPDPRGKRGDFVCGFAHGVDADAEMRDHFPHPEPFEAIAVGDIYMCQLFNPRSVSEGV